MNALIIGAGIAGSRHAKAQKQLGNKVGYFLHNPNDTHVVESNFNSEYFTNLGEAIDWSDIVHICTPDHLHTDYALATISAGKTVLCEKPLADNLNDAEKIFKAVKKQKTNFFVGTNYRLNAAFQAIKQSKDSGLIGKIISVESTYLHDMRTYQSQTLWRRQQDFLYGGGIHAIDLAIWIIGEKVVEVQAITGKKFIKNYKKQEDYHIQLRFTSGIVASIWLNARVVQPYHGINLRVYGEKGVYLAHNKSRFLQFYFESSPTDGYTAKSIKQNLTIDDEVKIIDQWLKGERKDHDPVPDIYEAMQVMYVIAAIEKSIKSGKIEKVY